MIRRLILSLLATPDHRAALARVAHLEGRVFELETNRAALDLLAASEEHRADEAERMLDREQMIAAKLTTELAEVRKRLSDEPAPRSIRPTREAVLAAEVASLRLDLAAADQRSEEWRVAHDRLSMAGVPATSAGPKLATLETRIGWLVDQRTGAERGWSKASHELALLSKGAASCACSADARRSSDADEVLR